MTAMQSFRAALAITLAAPAALVGQTPADAAAIDRVFADYAKPGSPGCAIAVARDGRIVYEKGYGYANLDWDIPITPATVFNIGSTSKQFVAASIVLLAEDGKLSLDDNMRKWLPEMHDFGAPITIRNLLHHTSGVRDLLELTNVISAWDEENRYTTADFMRVLTAQRELNFPPGSQHLYSNSGYFLLAQIVQRASGKSLRAFADERIFRPLGMSDTHFHDDHRMVVKNRAISYAPQGGEWVQSFTFNFDRVGPGGLNSTVRDLAKWNHALFNGKIGGPRLLATMLTRGVLTNGDTLRYALGLQHIDRRGLPMVGHDGASLSFRADLMRFPTERMDFITLCNHAGSVGSLAALLGQRVSELYLADRMRPPVQASAPAPAQPTAFGPLDAAALAAYAGEYRSPELDMLLTIQVENGGLVARRISGQKIPLTADARDRFRALQRSAFDFQRDATGRITGFRWQGNRVRNLLFERVRSR
jgi:CubicO group peptidase (beta-lactamase class C family)